MALTTPNNNSAISYKNVPAIQVDRVPYIQYRQILKYRLKVYSWICWITANHKNAVRFSDLKTIFFFRGCNSFFLGPPTISVSQEKTRQYAHQQMSSLRWNEVLKLIFFDNSDGSFVLLQPDGHKRTVVGKSIMQIDNRWIDAHRITIWI